MKTYTAVVEQCPDTGLYVGYVPGFPGAHTQGETLDELNKNLLEVIEMLLEDGEPELEALYIHRNPDCHSWVIYEQISRSQATRGHFDTGNIGLCGSSPNGAHTNSFGIRMAGAQRFRCIREETFRPSCSVRSRKTLV
jgi:predicted RNase H-like HicB family nuclease